MTITEAREKLRKDNEYGFKRGYRTECVCNECIRNRGYVEAWEAQQKKIDVAINELEKIVANSVCGCNAPIRAEEALRRISDQ